MRRAYKWIIAIGTSTVVFGLCWWFFDILVGIDTGDALGIAAVPGGLASTLLGWWAGRELSGVGTTLSYTQPYGYKPLPSRFDASTHTFINTVRAARGQVVVGPVPREPKYFQKPTQVVRALVIASRASRRTIVCSVTGQRGIGKTQAAGAYARKRILDGWLVAWIPAHTEDIVETGLLELADALRLRHTEDTNAATFAKLRNYLQTFRDPALLIFDSVTNPDHVIAHLPATGSAQVVLTSASRTLDRVGLSIPVELFSLNTAVRFLKAITGLEDDTGARAVAEELGYLPLALAQAAARISRNDRDFETYLRRYYSLPVSQLLKACPGDTYPHGTVEAILLAVEPFTIGHNNDELLLLNLLSVLSPDGVSRLLLGILLGESIGDPIETLLDTSLVEFAGADNAVIVMHRLTQRVIRDRAGHSLPSTLDFAAERI